MTAYDICSVTDEAYHIHTPQIQKLNLRYLIFLIFFLFYTHTFAVLNKLIKPFLRQLKRQNINWPKVSGPPSSFQEGLKEESVRPL